MTALEELADTTRVVAQRVGPSVVRIGRRGGRGCGVVVGDGVILTNAHNLRGPETTVLLPGGTTAQAELAGADMDRDIAVLALPTAGTELVPVEWSPSAPAPGDVVFAVARGASGTGRVTYGSVTATERSFRGPRGRRIAGSLEHTAPLVRGSSGSAVVDPQGRLVGINTNRLGDGFYLALPADEQLRRRAGALAEGHSPQPRRLGVGLVPTHVARKLRRSVGLPERDGVLVRIVEEGSPAAAAGVREGDLIVRAGEREIASADDLFDALDAGETIKLTVLRGVDEVEIEVSFATDDEAAGGH